MKRNRTTKVNSARKLAKKLGYGRENFVVICGHSVAGRNSDVLNSVLNSILTIKTLIINIIEKEKSEKSGAMIICGHPVNMTLES